GKARKQVTYKGFASNGFAVKCIYIYVLSGRGPSPEGAGIRATHGGRRRMSSAAQNDSNKKASDLVGISPWFAPLRAFGCSSANRRTLPGRSAHYDCGLILWRK